MKNNKGSISIDVIAATFVLLLVLSTIAACFNTQKYIVASNIEIQQYGAAVVTKLTDLEKMDVGYLRSLDGTTEIEDSIQYSYSCSNSSYGTLHVEVTAQQKKLNHTFVVEKGLIP